MRAKPSAVWLELGYAGPSVEELNARVEVERVVERQERRRQRREREQLRAETVTRSPEERHALFAAMHADVDAAVAAAK